MSKHFVHVNYESVNSLLTLCLENIISNIHVQSEDLLFLPNHIKSRILKRLNSLTLNYSNIKSIYRMLVHSQLKHMNLSSTQLDNEFLKIIYCCHNLRELILTRTKNDILTEPALLEAIPNFQKLLVFHAPNCEAVSNAVIKLIVENCPNISEIDIDGCNNITDDSLVELSKLEHLSALNISRTKVTSAGIIQLVEGPSGHLLKELRIAECKGVDHKAMHTICEKCTSLEVFIFYNCSEVKDILCIDSESKGFKNLKQLTWSVYW